jgi:hypothetical protein
MRLENYLKGSSKVKMLRKAGLEPYRYANLLGKKIHNDRIIEIIIWCGGSHSVLTLCCNTDRTSGNIGKYGHIFIIIIIIILSNIILLRPVMDTTKPNPSIVQSSQIYFFSAVITSNHATANTKFNLNPFSSFGNETQTNSQGPPTLRVSCKECITKGVLTFSYLVHITSLAARRYEVYVLLPCHAIYRSLFEISEDKHTRVSSH